MTTTTGTTRYGTAVARAWDRLHPRLGRRSAWLEHDGPLPVIEGTVIRLQVDHLPGDRHPKPVWLWCSGTGAPPAGVDQLWQAFLRRFDLEHTFRMFGQVPGWTAPKLRDSAAADRWTWLIITAYAQLRLARPLAADLRLPWERPAPPGRLTGSAAGLGTSTPPRRPWPAARVEEPPPSTRHHVGKTTKREPTLKARRERAG